MAFRVLCIDDDVRELCLRETVLQTQGYVVFTATSGPLGLDVLKHVIIDVVVLDYAMPEMDGTAVAIEIRRVWVRLPIVVLSGHDISEIPPPLLALTNGFVDKGAPPGELFTALKKVLKKVTGRGPVAA